MADDAICANWRAALVPLDGTQPLYGRLHRLAGGQLVVGTDHNLKPGYRCNLTLMLPKDRPDEPASCIAGSGVVVNSVLSSMQFHITLKWEVRDADGTRLLNERVSRFEQTWRR